jgi:signal peptidase I
LIVASDTKKKEEEKPFRLQEHVEWIAVAFVLALTVRCFVVEAYQIPTGSMAPALYGKNADVTCPDCGTKYTVGVGDSPYFQFTCPSCGREGGGETGRVKNHGGDRILVSKDLYLFSKPRRWEVFVFKSHERDKQNMNFVKRIVGLPGEHIELRDGQVFADGVIVSKPDRVQNVLWQEAYKWDGTKATDNWNPTGDWAVMPEGLLLRQESDAWQTVEYNKRITDFYPYDGRPGDNLVSDLCVSGRLRMDSTACAFTAGVWADSTAVKATFIPAGSLLNVELRVNEQVMGEKQVALTSDRSFDFTVFTVDGRYGVDVNGDEVMRFQEVIRAEDTPLFTKANGVFFQGQGGKLLVSNPEIKRDVYYRTAVAPGRPDSMAGIAYSIDIPQKNYLGLGDNSPVSSDSRVWGTVPEENILGKAFFLFWPPTRIKPVI